MSTELAFKDFHRPPRSPAAVEEAHPCVVLTCGLLCSPGHVACRRHWRQIPQGQRDPLIAIFQRRLSEPVLFERAQQRARQLVLHYAALLDN